jgi:hypothetical protein
MFIIQYNHQEAYYEEGEDQDKDLMCSMDVRCEFKKS